MSDVFNENDHPRNRAGEFTNKPGSGPAAEAEIDLAGTNYQPCPLCQEPIGFCKGHGEWGDAESVPAEDVNIGWRLWNDGQDAGVVTHMTKDDDGVVTLHTTRGTHHADADQDLMVLPDETTTDATFNWAVDVWDEARAEAWATEHDGIKPHSSYISDTGWLYESGSPTPVGGASMEKGFAGEFRAILPDGREVIVTDTFSVSQDDDGRWWCVYRTERTVEGGETEELSVGNVESVAWHSETDALRSLDQCRESQTFDEHLLNGHFDNIPDDDY